MSKQRVYELAKELEFDKHQLVDKINDLDLTFQVNNYMSMLTEAQAGEVRELLEQERVKKTVETKLAPGVRRRRRKKKRKVEEEPAAAAPTNGQSASPAAAPAVRRRKVGDDPSPVRVRKKEPAEAPAPEPAPAPVEEAPAEVVAEAPEAPAAVEAPAEVEAEAPAAAEAAEAPAEVAEVAEAPAEVAEAPAEATAEAVEAPAEAAEVAAEAPAEVAEAAAEVAEAPAEAAEAPAEAAEAKADNSTTESEELQRSKVDKRNPNSAKVLGRIDPEILRQRLRAEGKSFEPPGSSSGGPGGRRSRSSGSRPARPDARTSGGAAPAASKKSGGYRGRGRGGRRTVRAADLYDDNARIRRQHKSKRRKPAKTQITQAAEHKRVIKINEAIVLSDLAHQMGVKGNELVRTLMGMGEMMTINQAVDIETATLLAEEFNYTVENVSFDPAKYYDDTVDTPEELVSRPPVVTIMGHVDHGKTSLLDAIRSTDVASGEAGGITQHIGAYQVNVGGEDARRVVTFLDTPGHEAFTALRMRGAQVTDIVVLVVAADDGVMPQTVEAINHSRDAGVPIVVAVNKIDKPGANPDRVKQALTEYELIPEDWGGTTQFVDVSALQHTNIDVLLESLLLQAEIMELRANPDRAGYGVVIESRLDIGLGAVATILVQRGSVSPGDIVVAGEYYGRIRAMYNHRGEEVETAGPSMAVEITGLSGVPTSGEVFFQVEEEKTAREIVSNVQRKQREAELANRAKKPSGFDLITDLIARGELKELKVIVKADVQGSIEAVKGSLEKLGNDEVGVKVIHSAVGGITENDVNLAASSAEGAIIVGFNVRPDSRASAAAEERGVDMVLHTIIYEIEDAITSILEGMLAPIAKEVDLGAAEVRAVFMVPKLGAIAGCYVTNGKIVRNGHCRVVRQGKIIYSSRISSLRRVKDDVREVKSGFECGINVANFNDVKVGDVIECYEIQEERATL